MSWQPHASLHAIETRAELYEKIRAFFQIKNVLEVETPILNTYTVTDEHIESIATEHSQYLHTSPEYAMKRLLAFYQRDIYQVCKVFRASEKGAYHHIEFTMLEWYRLSCSYTDLMQEVAELVKTLLCNSDESLETQHISYQEVFKNYLN